MPCLKSDFALALLLASVATVSVAEAQPGSKTNRKKAAPSAQEARRAARDAYDAGAIAFEKGEYQTAFENFSKANGLIPSPVAAYWVARSLDALGNKAEAIEAYNNVLTGPDAAKLGPDKTETAKARLALLEKAAAPVEAPVTSATLPARETVAPAPSAPAPLESAPSPSPTESDVSAVPEVPPPPPPEPAPRDFNVESPVTLDLPPREPPRNFVELGAFGGALFVSRTNDLRDPKYDRQRYDDPVWLAGVHGAFFPLPYLGLGLEYAHGFGKVDPGKDTTRIGDGSNRANFDSGRFQIIGQLPLEGFVPFAHVGAGVLRASSDRLGSDIDFLAQLGVGGKVVVHEILRPYFDARLGATQKRTGTGDDAKKGISVHPELLVGLSFVLGDLD